MIQNSIIGQFLNFLLLLAISDLLTMWENNAKLIRILIMCSTSITISEESFKSDFSDFPAQAVNDVVTTGVFSRDKRRHQYASCRSGKLKSLSLDKLPLQNVTPAFTPLDSLVTKSLLDMTRAQEAETNNIQERASNFLKTEDDDSADQAELSATILGNNQT